MFWKVVPKVWKSKMYIFQSVSLSASCNFQFYCFLMLVEFASSNAGIWLRRIFKCRWLFPFCAELNHLFWTRIMNRIQKREGKKPHLFYSWSCQPSSKVLSHLVPMNLKLLHRNKVFVDICCWLAAHLAVLINTGFLALVMVLGGRSS